MARKLEVEIVGDAASLHKALGKADSSSSSFGKTIGKLGKTAALTAGGAGLGALAIGLKIGISSYMDAQKNAAQTNAVIKSTGGIANVSAKQVGDLATALMKKSGVDDDVIQSGENMLLTFTNIRNEAGKGNDIFDQTTKTLLDMSVATGQDMPKAAVMLGKAINDPIAGVGALSRVGVTFTEGQKKTIKALVESGHAMDAQKIILGELKKEFGGSAEAAGKTLPGQLAIAQHSFENFAGELVAKAIPYLQRFVTYIQANMPLIRARFQELMTWLRANLFPVFKDLSALVVQVVSTIRQNWGTIGPIVQTVANIVKTQLKIVGDALRIITALLRGDWAGAWKAARALVVDIITSLVQQVKIRLQILAALFGAIGPRIKSGLSAALSGIGALVSNALSAIHHAIRAVAGAAYGWAQEIGKQIIFGIAAGIRSVANSIKDAAVGAVKGALGAAKGALHIRSPSQVFADQVGKPIGDGIAAGILASEKAIINALKGVLSRAIATRNFGAVSSIIQQMFSAKQAAVRTPAEAKIARIERARSLEDLNKGIKDAAASLATAQHDLAVAQGTGDTAGAAEASARIVESRAALARAQQDLQLFHLQEQAAKQRAALDAKQMAAQIKLGLVLDKLSKQFDNTHVTTKQLLLAIRRILHNLHIPGFAGGVTNFHGGLAVVGERGPEVVNLPRGSNVIPNGGAVASRPMIINLVLDGKVAAQALIDPLRGEAQIFKQRTGREAFA